MAELGNRERLQPALLDRLTDNAPERKTEPMDHQVLQLSQLRQSVMRDLSWLLNTAQLELLEDLSGFPMVQKSTVNYGIPSFSGTVASRDRTAALERTIAEAIRTFEPRIRPDSLRVRLRPQPSGEPLPLLVFEISGELWAKPVPLQLFLETAFELETNTAVVIESGGRSA